MEFSRQKAREQAFVFVKIALLLSEVDGNVWHDCLTKQSLLERLDGFEPLKKAQTIKKIINIPELSLTWKEELVKRQYELSKIL